MRFIHLADVHLGAVPDRGCPWSQERGEEIWETFRRVIAQIRKSPVELLFIAGDLFHRQPLLRELKEVNYLFSTIPDTEIFLMAGNHDYMKKDSFYRSFEWEDNVHFFREEAMTGIHLEDLNVTVYGMSYEHQEIHDAVYDDLRPQKESGFSVLLAHGGDASHIPMDFKKIAGSGFDYIALGHIHKPQLIFRDKMSYPGALEPIDHNDIGAHGYILGKFENGKVHTEFIPFASRSYLQLLLTVREDSTQLSLEERLRMDLMEKGGNNIYSILIKGIRSPELLFFPEKLKKQGNIIEVIDQSKPAYDLKALEKKYSGTLIGDYISYFMEKNQEGLTMVEEKALYYGLQALLETGKI